MNPLEDNFLETDQGRRLFEQGLELYKNIEAEHAHTVELNDITLGYLEFGPTTGVPLIWAHGTSCLLYTSPSPRDQRGSRMPSSA